MTDYKLAPYDPTPEMVSAAEDAYMPFGDMELAIRMAILAAPDVQGEPVAEVCKSNNRFISWHIDIDDIDDGTELFTQPPSAGAVPEPFMRLYRHARGLSFGHDWNKGTAQGYHRKPLLEAVKECEAMLTAAPTAQPVQGGEWVAGDDKRPTEEDADHWGRVFVWFPEVPDEEPEVAHVSEFSGADEFTLARIMWKPTGLTRPQPPKTKEDRGHE